MICTSGKLILFFRYSIFFFFGKKLNPPQSTNICLSNLHIFMCSLLTMYFIYLHEWVWWWACIYLSKLVELIFYRVILIMSLILSEWVHWLCINEWVHRAWIFLSDSADKHVFTWVSSLSLYLPEWVHCPCIYLSEFVDHGGGGLILVLSCPQGLLVFCILLTDCLEGMLQLYKKRQNSELAMIHES